METVEHIKVFIRYDEYGRTICICPRWDKRCKRHCMPEVVERDKFRGIEYICRVDRYGKSRERDD